MNKILFLIFYLNFFTLFSQQKQFVINWEDSKTFSTLNTNIKVPFFKGEHYSLNEDNQLKFINQWEATQRINEEYINISQIKLLPIERSKLYDLDVNAIAKTASPILKNITARGKQSVYFEMNPIINDKGVFKKVVSFTITYNSMASNSRFNTFESFSTIQNSVLNQGEWYKFYVDTTGVFKLNQSFLNRLGINTNNLNPKSIKIYGQGGRMLPMENSVDYPLDLTENAIKVIGEDDNVFNNNDYILFYAEGPKEFNEESNTHINCYTDKAYYYINISAGFGKRIQPLLEPQENPTTIIDTFHDYQFHEVDEFNLVNLGRRWFGDKMDIEPQKTFDFEFPNLITTAPIFLKVFTAAVSEINTSMKLNVNGVEVDDFTFVGIDDPILARGDNFQNNITVSSTNISVNLQYNNNGNPSSEAYLDYIAIEGLRPLEHINGQFRFKNNNVALLNGVGQYNIANATNISEVWDVTDIFNVKAKSNTNSETIFSFKANFGEQRLYMAVNPSDYFEPKHDSQTRVSNQNLKGTVFQDEQGQFQDIDYIIITRTDMVSQAERLAQINRNQYNLNVKVIELSQIYNEFSSGNQDISAIRNFIKYVYDNASSPDKRIKYLCLFGDASFDYKERVTNNTNVVPSWQSLQSFSLTSSFVSDDYFGMMDDNEGNAGMTSTNRLDIAVGRILADTPQRAKQLVDKIESYYANEAFGNWRNNVMVISDDVDSVENFNEGILQTTTNNIGDIITLNKPFLNVTKVHTDSFQQQTTAGGDRYPDVNQTIFDEIEVGSLVVNYFGHGGEEGIASERIFDQVNAQEVTNVCKLNCFVTVTCEYTKFDNPFRETAGEFLYWNTNGGAVALITTTRKIFVTVGVNINIKLEEYLFAFGSNNYPSMAEAVRLTKIDPAIGGIAQKRLIFFIGDPAMQLAFPKPNIRLTQINDQDISNINTEVLQALSYAKLEGEVVNESGNLLTDYNGILTATIYDKEIERSTLANDNTSIGGSLIILDFKTLGEIIFRGQATIQNGIFEFDFIVPRDIGIPVGNGKVSLYAKQNDFSEDQAGANLDIQIGGLNEDAPEDNEGPIISLFMNDENFVSGGITNEKPTLLAKLQDDNGINTASGIGHDIIAILDGDEANPYKLNDYYQTEVDDYTNGTVTYLLRDLEPGLHTLTFKAWDVYNNSSTSEIQFVVHNQNEELVINNVLNYPNPFINYTEFWFNHNSSETLDISIQIFTVSGKLVRTINGQTTSGSKNTSSLSKDIIWDGKDDFGDQIGKGVYVYKLTVSSKTFNKRVEKYEKLVIL